MTEIGAIKVDTLTVGHPVVVRGTENKGDAYRYFIVKYQFNNQRRNLVHIRRSDRHNVGRVCAERY